MTKKVEEIFFTCLLLVLLCVLSSLIWERNWFPPLIPLILFFVFYFKTYRGSNFSRICLSIQLLLSGVAGLVFGIMILLKNSHPVSGHAVILGLLLIFYGFLFLFNNSIKALTNREKSN